MTRDCSEVMAASQLLIGLRNKNLKRKMQGRWASSKLSVAGWFEVISEWYCHRRGPGTPVCISGRPNRYETKFTQVDDESQESPIQSTLISGQNHGSLPESHPESQSHANLNGEWYHDSDFKQCIYSWTACFQLCNCLAHKQDSIPRKKSNI